MLLPDGEVKADEPAIIRLLKVCVALPLIVVVPLNVTDPLLCVKIPLFVQFPTTFILLLIGPTNVDELAITK